jgi:lysozyme family protein
MAITIDSPEFKKYLVHVLQWEGLTSKNPKDKAASCAPVAGGIHTNKGVTFCTFKKYAAQLGITPVTYDRFLALSNDDVAKFVFLFMQQAEASPLPNMVALSVTEAAWMSGPSRAKKHLQYALNALGQKVTIDGDIGPATMNAVKNVDPKKLYEAYWIERKKYLLQLSADPDYASFKNGWLNRLNSFLQKFPVAAAAAASGFGVALIILAFFIFK